MITLSIQTNEYCCFDKCIFILIFWYSLSLLSLLTLYSIMRRKELYISILFLLGIISSCNRTPKDDGIAPPPLFPQPKSVEVNTNGGYSLNTVTGDTLKPIILESGDTLITGVPIPAKGKIIHPDSVSKPQRFKVPAQNQLTQKNAHPNVHPIPDELTEIPVNKDSLTKILLGEIAKNDTLHYILNSTGDTVKTGVPIPAKGKSVPTTRPQPTPALPPAFKDAAIANLQYLDVDQGMNSSYVFSILEDKNGNLWFGTFGGGVSMYNGETFTHFTEKEGLSNNIVRSMLEDKNVPTSVGIWFGTHGGGVSMYNGKTFTHFTEKEGLSNNIVYSILEDKNGNLWVGTEKGLNVIAFGGMARIGAQTQNEKKTPRITIHTFQKGDGLKGLDFFSNSAFIDSKNRAWWGCGKGLEMLDLNKFNTSQNPPAVHLRQLDINEQFIDYRNITDSLGNEIEFNGVQKFENYPLHLELPYDKNHLTFHFAAIDWSAPHKIKYSYRMLGLNDNWSAATHEAKAEYRNLPYGTYTFQVSAIGESGEWSEPFEYTFTIHPPWWHTTWFRVCYVSCFVLLLYLLYRWRTNSLRERQIVLEKTVDERTKEIVHQKLIVEEKHKEITDSINYAERIQRSFLATKELLDEHLQDYFVYFQPKDVVSGDFYWAAKLNNGSFALCCADSTGHGVPGAIMSILNISSLEKSTEKNNSPSEILNETRRIIIERLKKDGSPDGGKDGMDASLIVLNKEKTKLVCALANNPIWILRHSTEVATGYEIIEIEPDKMPVGKHDKDQILFTQKEFGLQKGDKIFAFTDGFADQFGGPKGKKFKYSKLKELFLENADKEMNFQSQIINLKFNEWKGDLEQVDDVCIIGIRI